MKGIKMSDCKFYVNKEERTVVCVISDTREMLENFMYDNFRFDDVDIYEGTNFYYKSRFGAALKMPNSFIGKAVCAPEDEWNEETGRMIAFSRAKDKCYQSFFKRANMLVQVVDRRLGDMMDMFNDFGVKLSLKREVLEKQIDERIGKE